jgi:hypothetical protein
MDTSFASRATAVAQAIIWWGALFGGTLLFAHFYKISYLPRFDLTSLMGTIAGVAGLGFLLVLVLAFLLVLPGVALVLADGAGVIQRMPRHNDASEVKEKVIKTRVKLLGAWGTGSLLAIITMALLITVRAPGPVFASVLWISVGLWLSLWFSAEVFGRAPLAKNVRRSVAHFYITFLLFGSMSFTLLYKMSEVSSQETPWLTLFGILLAVLFAQGLVYFSQGESLKIRFAIVGSVALLLLIGTSMSGIYSDSIGSFFRFGMMRNIELIVTEKGCEIMKAAPEATIRCKDPKVQGGIRSTGPVDLWTRIGADSLISAPGTLNCRGCSRLLIPNEEILSLHMKSPGAVDRTQDSASNLVYSDQ